MSSSKQRKPVSMTALRKTLSQCAFNPREPGPLKVVAQMEDPTYWMLRAVENIMQIQTLPAAEHNKLVPLLTQSIQLLGLAKARLE